MSVVAWDGNTLAADMLAEAGGTVFTTSKLLVTPSGAFAGIVGDLDSGMMLAQWLCNTSDDEGWPECQRDKDRWALALVIRDGLAYRFEREPVAVPVLDKVHAIGSGKDVALTAMRLGESAVDAVRLACELEPSCGRGIESISLGETKKVTLVE